MNLDPGIDHHAQRPATVEPSSSMPARELRSLALDQLRSAQALLAGAGGSVHHGVHQARKGIRRVRAALALGADVLGRPAQVLDAELGRLCRGLSHLRDAQALVEALARLPVRGARADVDLPAAIALAQQRRETVLAAALVRDPQFIARRRRLARAQAIVARLPWDRMKGEVVHSTLARAERRVDKAQRRAKKHPARDEDWHRLRRRVRRLRQMQSLAGAAFGAESTSHAGTDVLAQALGESQDDTLIVTHCRSRSPFPAGLRRSLRAMAAERIHHARH